jgi:hypothetical protein
LWRFSTPASAGVTIFTMTLVVSGSEFSLAPSFCQFFLQKEFIAATYNVILKSDRDMAICCGNYFMIEAMLIGKWTSQPERKKSVN